MHETTVKVGVILPHWTAVSPGTPHWWASEIPGESPGWQDLLALARQIEAAGFDSIWTVDHMLIRLAEQTKQFGRPVPPELEDTPPVGVWECWSILAALAATTSRVALAPLVSCTGYRNPALLAKMATTVDEISGGRLILGLGAGDFEDDHRSFGMQWDHRVSRFEEALAIIHPLLREGRVDVEGRYYQARDCVLLPRGPRPEGPPLLIGSLGHGARMLDLTVRYADIWNGWIAGQDTNPDIVPALRSKVDAACLAAGRDPATLERSLTVAVAFDGRGMWGRTPLTGTAEEIAAALRGFAREGISHVQVWLNPATAEGVERLAAVLGLLERE